MLNVVSYEEAVARVAAVFAGLTGSETVSAGEAFGRIIASDTRSGEDVPAFPRSTVDGYAVAHTETNAASLSVPAVFELTGAASMGETDDLEAGGGRCVYVPTGAMLPRGADAVAMLEDAETRGGEILLSCPLRVWENVAQRGEDIRKNSVLLRRGEVVDACRQGALCASGTTAEVVRTPRFFLISTGDELTDCEGECPYGKVRDVNTILLKSAAQYWTCAGTRRLADDYDVLKSALQSAAEAADIVIISGGSSVGKADFTERLFEEAGEIFLRGIAMKPGKPTLAATDGKRLFIGLPGHPMAAFIAFKTVFERGFLRAAGTKETKFVYADAEINFRGGEGRTCVMPVALREGGNGFTAAPLFYKSGMASVLSSADGYAVIPDNVEGIYKGERLKIFLL